MEHKPAIEKECLSFFLDAVAVFFLLLIPLFVFIYLIPFVADCFNFPFNLKPHRNKTDLQRHEKAFVSYSFYDRMK